MRITRIYYPEHLSVASEITLSEHASHHLTNVLRLTMDAAVVLFDGSGAEFMGQIILIKKKSVAIKINQRIEKNNESPLFIHLAQGISRSEKMDFTIQKAVELGVSEITPVWTEYCNVKLNQAAVEKRMAHWQSVMISACEQCGRNVIPKINFPKSFELLVNDDTGKLCLILHQTAEEKLKDFRIKEKSVTILVGPEGGFSEKEVVLATHNRFHALQLGPRILRTETAALAAISVLQYCGGDFCN